MSLTAVVYKLLVHIWPFLKETVFGGGHADLFVRRNKWVIVLAFASIVFLFIYGIMLDGIITLNTKLRASQERVLFLERQTADNDRYKVENVTLQKINTGYAIELRRLQSELTLTNTSDPKPKKHRNTTAVSNVSINDRLSRLSKTE